MTMSGEQKKSAKGRGRRDDRKRVKRKTRHGSCSLRGRLFVLHPGTPSTMLGLAVPGLGRSGTDQKGTPNTARAPATSEVPRDGQTCQCLTSPCEWPRWAFRTAVDPLLHGRAFQPITRWLSSGRRNQWLLDQFRSWSGLWGSRL